MVETWTFIIVMVLFALYLNHALREIVRTMEWQTKVLDAKIGAVEKSVNSTRGDIHSYVYDLRLSGAPILNAAHGFNAERERLGHMSQNLATIAALAEVYLDREDDESDDTPS